MRNEIRFAAWKFREIGVRQSFFTEARVPFLQGFLRDRARVIRFNNGRGEMLLGLERMGGGIERLAPGAAG